MKIDKKNVVLGTGNFAYLDEKSCRKILFKSLDLGIFEFDTAPLYLKSEEVIGKYVGAVKELNINTKVGLPKIENFLPKGIQLSVETSLKRLKVERINTLFVHSLPIDKLTDENVETLIRLKSSGKIRQIGYSGDGNSLNYCIKNFNQNFDSYMATYNLLDQANEKYISSLDTSRFYIKRVFANAVWAKLSTRTYVRNVYLKLRKRTNPKGLYLERLRHFNLSSEQLTPEYFLSFVHHIFPESKKVYGCSSVSQLSQLSDLNLLDLGPLAIQKSKEKFSELSNKEFILT